MDTASRAEEFLRLYESLDTDQPYEIRKTRELPEIKQERTTETGTSKAPEEPALTYPQYVQPMIIPYYQPVPAMQVSQGSIQLIVSYTLRSGLKERALFSPNNLNSALELYHNASSEDIRIGITVREHDLWFFEWKSGVTANLFTETAFYQLGCSSPEVQLIRMIYSQVERGLKA